MSKLKALPGENYQKILAFRSDLFSKMINHKLSPEDFANACFQYVIQNKIKPVAKARDIDSILLNYYYWLIQIERKVAIERQLMAMGLGSEEKYRQLTEVFVKRRDQMVRRLVWELDVPVESAYLIFGDTVEIQLKTGEILYSSKESLDKVKFYVDRFGRSMNPHYLKIIHFSYKA